MARTSRQTRTRTRTRNHSGTNGVRVLPQTLLRTATDIVRDRPLDLDPAERGRLRELVGRAGGRGINLSPRERSEVSVLVDRANAKPVRSTPMPLVKSRRATARRAAR